ncbi:MAG: RNA polymerase sigma factor [Bacteroidales bacterium]|nr:RNA polymerase sigma factor [Bacteroidales bacterium]
MKPDFLTATFITLRLKLHRSALNFLRNEEEASDALQDTFARLWEKGPVESDEEARNKLFAVLRNVCIDRLRRQSNLRLSDSDTDEKPQEPTSGEDIDRLQTLMMSGLSDIQRQIVTLVADEQLSPAEIGHSLGLSEGAVRTALCRARMKMRENYKKLDR